MYIPALTQHWDNKLLSKFNTPKNSEQRPQATKIFLTFWSLSVTVDPYKSINQSDGMN